MIIYDFSNIVIGAAMSYFQSTRQQIDLNLLRHIALNCIISDKSRHDSYVGNLGVVLAFDSRHYWRKDVFKHYKGTRKKGRDKSDFDFNTFYGHFNTLKEEFSQSLPYKCVEVDKAEADDIIAVLAKTYVSEENICIVASDKDMLQVQKYSSFPWSIFQYSPKVKKFITPESKELTLYSHIIGGDSIDGIPNIWSDEDTYVTDGKRCKQFSSKTKQLVDTFVSDEDLYKVLVTDELKKRYEINKTLIDLDCIPQDLQYKILETFKETKSNNKTVFDYLVKHKLTQILKRGKI